MLSAAEQVETILPFALDGTVTRIVGLTVAAAGFPAPLGAICRIHREQGSPVDAAVVGFQGEETLLLAYGDLAGVRRGNRVTLLQSVPGARVGERLLGRVLDGRGRFIDNLPAPARPHRVPLHGKPMSPLGRPRIDAPLGTGVRVIDALLTCGKGQRLGIFSGSGVGKSTLLGQMARASSADVNVIVLVGERGREVREFLERDLGSEGLARSVVVVATSDEPALVRLNAAFLGTAVAEYFRDTRRDVLLMMDSVTRFALAQREIGLAAGEPPATRGYPPSVFALLPKLLERSGRTAQGSITGLYNVLVEADDANEPISDTVPRHVGRPHHAFPQARPPSPLARDRSAGKHQPIDERCREPRASERGRKPQAASRGLPAIGGSDHDRSVPNGLESNGRPGDQAARADRGVPASILFRTRLVRQRGRRPDAIGSPSQRTCPARRSTGWRAKRAAKTRAASPRRASAGPGS